MRASTRPSSHVTTSSSRHDHLLKREVRGPDYHVQVLAGGEVGLDLLVGVEGD